MTRKEVIDRIRVCGNLGCYAQVVALVFKHAEDMGFISDVAASGDGVLKALVYWSSPYDSPLNTALAECDWEVLSPDMWREVSIHLQRHILEQAD